MSEKQIRADLVSKTLQELGPTFRTKDLSGHQIMLEGHPTLRGQRNYHAWVGRYLSAFCDEAEQISSKKNARGVMWRNKIVAVHEPRPPESATGLGPQYGGDNAFTARMRLQQSRYRAKVLGVPCGTGPMAHSRSLYGNMLRREDGARGLNFISPEIQEVALERMRQSTGTVEPFRLLHNMLSSQPMCFNIFGPLVRDHDVKIEFAPEPRYEYLDDRTAFDAFIDYRRNNGTRAFLGIETKLTEPFSAKHYDAPSYRRWMQSPDSPWRADALDNVSLVRHNQLWRDHLLAIALRDHEASPYQHGALMLVRHPDDRSCARVVDGYRDLLVEHDTTFIDMPLDQLVETWRSVLKSDPNEKWAEDLKERYLKLKAGEETQ